MTTNDKKEIKEIVMDALSDFYQQIIEPNFDRIDNETQEIKNEIIGVKEELKQDIYELRQEVTAVTKNHEKRIQKLETATSV